MSKVKCLCCQLSDTDVERAFALLKRHNRSKTEYVSPYLAPGSLGRTLRPQLKRNKTRAKRRWATKHASQAWLPDGTQAITCQIPYVYQSDIIGFN